MVYSASTDARISSVVRWTGVKSELVGSVSALQRRPDGTCGASTNAGCSVWTCGVAQVVSPFDAASPTVRLR